MTITDESRYRLHQRLEQLLGPDEAATLMEHLPPVGWADVATKQDLRHEFGMLRADLRAEFRGEMGSLRGDMESLRAEFHGEMGSLRGEFGGLRGEFGDLRGEFGGLRGELEGLRAEVQRDLRLQLLAIMGFNSALVAATYAVARLT